MGSAEATQNVTGFDFKRLKLTLEGEVGFVSSLLTASTEVVSVTNADLVAIEDYSTLFSHPSLRGVELASADMPGFLFSSIVDKLLAAMETNDRLRHVDVSGVPCSKTTPALKARYARLEKVPNMVFIHA
jgi:hypothetical protein